MAPTCISAGGSTGDILRQQTEAERNKITKPQTQNRRGPKPKLIKDRTLPTNIQPIRRQERSWSQSQKLRVLVFLHHHRVPREETIERGTIPDFRPPTQVEAADIFGVPQTTIANWVRKHSTIEQLATNSVVRTSRTGICRWGEMESQLYSLFLEKRELGQPVRRGWFRRHANALFHKLYPSAATTIFRFSNGWFEAFLGRFRVSLRAITKKAQAIPEDYRRLVVNWLCFNRRNSQPLPLFNHHRILLGDGFICTTGRYLLSNIFNVDETPLPFEYLNGRTYNTIGDKIVWVKETRSGWDKQQASLVLCIFADGVNRVPPLIIFHGKGTVYDKEVALYHPGVIVEFNDKAYMNDELFQRYVQIHILPVLEGRPSLFALDLCTSHTTPAVLNIFRSHNIVPSLIPAGCTSLIQPLDVAINKPIKERIRELTFTDIERLEDNGIVLAGSVTWDNDCGW